MAGLGRQGFCGQGFRNRQADGAHLMFGSAARPLERRQTVRKAVRFLFPQESPRSISSRSRSIAGTGNHQMTSITEPRRVNFGDCGPCNHRDHKVLSEYCKQELQQLLGKPSQNCTGDWRSSVRLVSPIQR